MDPPQEGDEDVNVIGGMVARLGFGEAGRGVRPGGQVELMEQLGLGEGTRVVDLQVGRPRSKLICSTLSPPFFAHSATILASGCLSCTDYFLVALTFIGSANINQCFPRREPTHTDCRTISLQASTNRPSPPSPHSAHRITLHPSRSIATSLHQLFQAAKRPITNIPLLSQHPRPLRH